MEWESFLPPFFGVLGAFLLQWVGRKYDRGKDRKQFLRDIRRELETGSSLLTGVAQLLPTDMWESGKASGFLSLLSHDVRVKFATVYFSIQSHNYESVRLRDESTLAFTTTEKPKAEFDVKLEGAIRGTAIVKSPFTSAQLLHQAHAATIQDTENGVKKLIDDLLKEKIWE